MSYMQEIDFDFQVGDQIEVSPLEGSYVIGKILAAGGECYLEGNTVIVSAFPGQAPKPEAPAAVEETPAAEEEVVQAVEEDLGGTDLGTAEIGDPVEEVVAPAAEEVVKPVPAKRGRKPAVVAVEETPAVEAE